MGLNLHLKKSTRNKTDISYSKNEITVLVSKSEDKSNLESNAESWGSDETNDSFDA